MKFEVFDSLTPTEATEFLANFLKEERGEVMQMLGEASREGVKADFTIESIPLLLRWAAGKAQLSARPRDSDPTVPSWIRESESYKRGLFEFNEASGLLILRCAYYLGESFVRSRKNLRWAVGADDTAVANMPVVAGFRGKLEMAPLLVVENLFGRIHQHGGPLEGIDRAVKVWMSDAT